jgi:hypothetical protein
MSRADDPRRGESGSPEAGPSPRRFTRKALFDDASPSLDRFGLVLVLTATSVSMLSLVDLTSASSGAVRPLAWVAGTLVAGALLLALRAAGLARRWQRVADALIVTGLALALLVSVVIGTTGASAGDVDTAPPVVAALLAILTPVVVIRRLLRHRRVSTGTLFGAVSVYLLIPIAFFYLYLSVDAVQQTPVLGDPQPTTTLMYFSITTLTTVGFGDFSPATTFVQYLASSEAMLGQIYLVTFVGMIVGLLVAGRREP